MPDYKLQAPESEGTGAGEVYVTGDPAERAQLLARGYTEIDNDADASTDASTDAGTDAGTDAEAGSEAGAGSRPAGTQKAKATASTKPPRASSPAPGVEIRQPDSTPLST